LKSFSTANVIENHWRRSFSADGEQLRREVQLRLITELRGLYRKAFPASRHVI
jgi:hypothetical protein